MPERVVSVEVTNDNGVGVREKKMSDGGGVAGGTAVDGWDVKVRQSDVAVVEDEVNGLLFDDGVRERCQVDVSEVDRVVDEEGESAAVAVSVLAYEREVGEVRGP